MDTKETIGDVLRRVRDEAGMSRRELAHAMGEQFGEQIIARMETGERSVSADEAWAWWAACGGGFVEARDISAALCGLSWLKFANRCLL